MADMHPHLPTIHNSYKALLVWQTMLGDYFCKPFTHKELEVIENLEKCNQAHLSNPETEKIIILNLQQLADMYDSAMLYACDVFNKLPEAISDEKRIKFVSGVMQQLLHPRLLLGGLPDRQTLESIRTIVNKTQLRPEFTNHIQLLGLDYFNIESLTNTEYQSLRDPWAQPVESKTPLYAVTEEHTKQQRLNERPDIKRLRSMQPQSLITRCINKQRERKNYPSIKRSEPLRFKERIDMERGTDDLPDH